MLGIQLSVLGTGFPGYDRGNCERSHRVRAVKDKYVEEDIALKDTTFRLFPTFVMTTTKFLCDTKYSYNTREFEITISVGTLSNGGLKIKGVMVTKFLF